MTKRELADLKRKLRAEESLKIVKRRCVAIFRHQQENAKELERSIQIDYTAEDLYKAAAAAQGEPCHWCERKITPKNFCFDHMLPTARGGSFSRANLDIPCAGCNQKKGNLNYEEFESLLALLNTFPPEARGDALTRLGVGGRWKRS